MDDLERVTGVPDDRARLTGKTAIVTGGGSGIGFAIATRLTALGAKVVVTDVDGSEQRTATALGGSVAGLRADAASEHDARRMVDFTLDTFGGLEVLCNNAGIDGQPGPLVECDIDNLNRVFAVNVTSVALGIKYAMPQMISRGGGSIITIASAAGLVASAGMGVYSASKAAAIQLTRVAAIEGAASGVRANSICPGVVGTRMVRELSRTHPNLIAQARSQIPMGRIAEPDEIAGLAAFLASDESSYITGTAVAVDGGMVSW